MEKHQRNVSVFSPSTKSAGEYVRLRRPPCACCRGPFRTCRAVSTVLISSSLRSLLPGLSSGCLDSPVSSWYTLSDGTTKRHASGTGQERTPPPPPGGSSVLTMNSPPQGESVKRYHSVFARHLHTGCHLRLVQLGEEELLEEMM